MSEIDIIFSEVDSLLLKGEFEKVNNLLASVDTNNILILVAWLSITLRDKERFPARQALLEKVKVLAPDRAERLLYGLV